MSSDFTSRFKSTEIEQIDEWFDKNSIIDPDDLLQPEDYLVSVSKFLEFLQEKRFHRRSFHYPTYMELMKEVEKCEPGRMGTTKLTKDQVYKILNTWVIEPTLEHELKLAFQVFDTEGKGYLELDELRNALCEFGDEKLNEEEVQELFRDSDSRGCGLVYYEDFITSLLRNDPNLKRMKVEYLYDDPDEDPSVPPLPKEESEPNIESPMNDKESSKKELVKTEAKSQPELNTDEGIDTKAGDEAATNAQPEPDSNQEATEKSQVEPIAAS